MNQVKKMRDKLFDLSVGAFVRAKLAWESNSSLLLLAAGFVILFHGYTKGSLAYAADGDGDRWGSVCSKIMTELEGDLGSLLTACAGIGAVCAAAMGGFKMAWTLIVVSVGSFVLGEYYQIFFNECSG
ncbi:MAG TPA: hypothetical protein PLP17_11095 [Oligoflexia bacterium]|nr:hypothetical protein [Oligoflexia bacterium]